MSNQINQKEVQKMSSEWLEKANSLIGFKSGALSVKDKSGNKILLEFEHVDSKSQRLNEIIKDASDILAQIYASMELQFAQNHPETVSSEMFLKPLEQLFKDGVDKVDWSLVEQGLKTNLKQFFCTTDFAKYSNANDFQLFVVAKDAQTGMRLGMIQFTIMPEFLDGNVRVAFFGVTPEFANFGREFGFEKIEKLLIASIFKFLPVTRIFLHTRTTNEKALAMYRDFGFVKFEGPLAFWADMEYSADKCEILQKVAESFDK